MHATISPFLQVFFLQYITFNPCLVCHALSYIVDYFMSLTVGKFMVFCLREGHVIVRRFFAQCHKFAIGL
jgi:hypothetical protein